MKLKSILAVLALVGASAAFMVGAGQSGAEGWRADFDALPATGGVARATCRFGTLARVYYDMDNAGTLELVHAVGGVELSKVVITNAAGAARGIAANLGFVDDDDFIRLTSSTNTAAKIYIAITDKGKFTEE